ncbi:MAG TPA: methyltransferase domain-containing protein, partial [Thermoanaerobaculia bacterium]|nr:methyltransferase domain-containing protein [Thermoanaerobaculia bacterium]
MGCTRPSTGGLALTPSPLPSLLALALAAITACSAPSGEMPSTGAPDVGSRSSQPTRAPARPPDVRFEPSPPEVVDAMLRLAAVGPDDVVFDLGCGDGRIVIAAVAELGARRGVCVEIDPALVARARHAARRAGVEERIDFVEGDLFAADLSDATVVALFL